MSILKKILLILFIITVPFLGLLLHMLSIPLIFSADIFRRTNRSIVRQYWARVLRSLSFFVNISFEEHGDQLKLKENAIVICNHQSGIDVILLLYYAAKLNMLEYNKWFAKALVRFIPGIGISMMFLDNIFLKRNWTKDRASVEKVFNKFKSNKIPIWLFIFPEGTRISSAKMKKVRDDNKIPWTTKFKNLLPPRKKGFTYSVMELRNVVSAVYDVTIYYRGGMPSMLKFLFGEGVHVRFDLLRFPINDLPKGEDELYSWLLHRFREKDNLLTMLSEDERARGFTPIL